MSNDKSKRRTVVLDGSNIVSGGAGGEDVDGHRLVSAVDLYTKKGYDVIPVMKNGTYYWMKNNNITGFDAVRRLKNDGILKMFDSDDDEGPRDYQKRPRTPAEASEARRKRYRIPPEERDIVTGFDWGAADGRPMALGPAFRIDGRFASSLRRRCAVGRGGVVSMPCAAWA